MSESNAGYASEAPALLQRYEAMSFESVHSNVLSFFPSARSSIVDIGSGTGRDAAYLAAKGHKVVAVEPTPEMREGAKSIHIASEIEWIDDWLPDLHVLRARSETFDVVILNAVWMHLDLRERVAGMNSIASLMHPGSKVFLKLRHGTVPVGRVMFEVTGEEVLNLASPYGLAAVYLSVNESAQQHNADAGITWTDIVLEKL